MATWTHNLSFAQYYIDKISKSGSLGKGGTGGLFVNTALYLSSDVNEKSPGAGHQDLGQGPMLNVEKILNDAGVTVAQSWRDLDSEKGPNHYYLVYKDENGVWSQYDHTYKNRRGTKEDFVNIYGYSYKTPK
ncbi:MAG: hypothetical protein F9K24_21095 [Leptonema illini]|uniref:Uncharacterized protein n=1 Tax=Leptonema illini TaxID=183 RepID=A0A833GXM9_9LEPT|nr:MAG: hypothetical protein F9K24_21095 [Leptonema illini]